MSVSYRLFAVVIIALYGSVSCPLDAEKKLRVDVEKKTRVAGSKQLFEKSSSSSVLSSSASVEESPITRIGKLLYDDSEKDKIDPEKLDHLCFIRSGADKYPLLWAEISKKLIPDMPASVKNNSLLLELGLLDPTYKAHEKIVKDWIKHGAVIKNPELVYMSLLDEDTLHAKLSFLVDNDYVPSYANKLFVPIEFNGASHNRPLLIASILGEKRTKVRQLLRDGASVITQDPITGFTALHHAIASQDRVMLQDVLRHLPKGRHVDSIVNSSGTTACHYAVTVGNCEALTRLIQRRANVHYCSGDEGTLIIAAAHAAHRNPTQRAAYKEVVKILAQQNVDVNACNKDGMPWWLELCNKEEQTFLTECGADINGYTKNGDTPLMLAVKAGKSETVQQLLAHGASIDSGSRAGGATPWVFTIRNATTLPPQLVQQIYAQVSDQEKIARFNKVVQDKRVDILRSYLAQKEALGITESVIKQAYATVVSQKGYKEVQKVLEKYMPSPKNEVDADSLEDREGDIKKHAAVMQMVSASTTTTFVEVGQHEENDEAEDVQEDDQSVQTTKKKRKKNKTHERRLASRKKQTKVDSVEEVEVEDTLDDLPDLLPAQEDDRSGLVLLSVENPTNVELYNRVTAQPTAQLLRAAERPTRVVNAVMCTVKKSPELLWQGIKRCVAQGNMTGLDALKAMGIGRDPRMLQLAAQDGWERETKSVRGGIRWLLDSADADYNYSYGDSRNTVLHLAALTGNVAAAQEFLEHMQNKGAEVSTKRIFLGKATEKDLRAYILEHIKDNEAEVARAKALLVGKQAAVEELHAHIKRNEAAIAQEHEDVLLINDTYDMVAAVDKPKAYYHERIGVMKAEVERAKALLADNKAAAGKLCAQISGKETRVKEAKALLNKATTEELRAHALMYIKDKQAEVAEAAIAFINQPNADGDTALHIAARIPSPASAQVGSTLYRAGANPFALNGSSEEPDRQCTSLVTAARTGNDDFINMHHTEILSLDAPILIGHTPTGWPIITGLCMPSGEPIRSFLARMKAYKDRHHSKKS